MLLVYLTDKSKEPTFHLDKYDKKSIFLFRHFGEWPNPGGWKSMMQMYERIKK